MQGIRIIGDVEHVLVTAFKKKIKTSNVYLVSRGKPSNYDIVLDFNVGLDASVDSTTKMRTKTLQELQSLAENRSLKYIHIFCDGSTHDAAFVQQFQYDYGVNACCVNLGTLHAKGMASAFDEIEAGIASSNGIIRFIDSAAPLRPTSIATAVEAILFVLQNGIGFHGTLFSRDSGATKSRVSVHAANLSSSQNQPRCHFLFLEEEERVYEFIH